MTSPIEAEWKLGGSKADVEKAFENLVDGYPVKRKTKLKIYFDTEDYGLFRMGYYARLQAKDEQGKSIVRRKTLTPKDKKSGERPGLLSQIAGNAFQWQATIKSNGYRCSKQGHTKSEDKTPWLPHMPGLRDIFPAGLRSLFSHDFEAPLCIKGSTKEVRRTVEIPVDPKNPGSGKVEISHISVIFSNGSKYRLDYLEVENKDNSCSPEDFRSFMDRIEEQFKLQEIECSSADILYSLIMPDDVKKDVLGGRAVNIYDLPGIEKRNANGKYKPLVKGGQSARDFPVLEAA